MFVETIAALRQTDRKCLLRHLANLGATDPEQRAKAALAAFELLQERGVTWAGLLQIDPDAGDDDVPVFDWRAAAEQLTVRADLSRSDRAFALRLTKWKAPGAEGLARLREIVARVGLDLG